jgi:hypothetical protein
VGDGRPMPQLEPVDLPLPICPAACPRC